MNFIRRGNMIGHGGFSALRRMIESSAPPRGVAALVTAGAVFVMTLFVPGSHPGLAAGPRTLIWGRSGDVFTLEIPLSTDTQSTMVSTQLYNTLVRANPGQVEVEPDLATSWSTTPDGLTWTFQLRKGVTFHDGTPFDAEA